MKNLNFAMIEEAREYLTGVASRTPIFKATKLHPDLYIKMENLQRTGSFKIRGAYNKIAHLTEAERKRGIITASAGNHAQGVAFSATAQGIKSYICIPSTAPLSKISATRQLGGEVIIVDGDFDAAQKRSFALEKEHGLTYIHPYDDPLVAAGQGTIGLEILEQVPDVDMIVVPVGGGGLIAGIATAVKHSRPDIQIIGVESENMSPAYQSKRQHKRVLVDTVSTLADGIAVKQLGELTYQVIDQFVDQIVTVSEEEIQNAILRLLEDIKAVGEGSGAATIAAVLNQHIDTEGKKVCAVLSGGNINLNTIGKIIRQGLFNTGRITEYTVKVEDRPGELMEMLSIFKKHDANILSIYQYQDHQLTGLYGMIVRIEIETFNEDHRQQITQDLIQSHYSLLHFA